MCMLACMGMQVYAVQVHTFVVSGLACVCACLCESSTCVRVGVGSTSLVHAHFRGCVCSCLCLCLPPHGTLGVCRPTSIREYSTLLWGGGRFPSFSRAREKTDPGRARLPSTWYKMLKGEVETGQDCQLPAAPSWGPGKRPPPHTSSGPLGMAGAGDSRWSCPAG